jgi:hypothetical protein
LPSSMSSSLMIWYAASLGIDCSGIRYLRIQDRTINRIRLLGESSTNHRKGYQELT